MSRMISIALALIMLVTLLVGCTKPADPEKTPFIISIQDLDGVFNPFYSTSATDSSVVGMTQIAMFDADSLGKPIYGGDRACLALDFEQYYPSDKSYTDYTYVLKPNARFSDGTRISIKDVLFSLYVYLDPVYTGSATMYSTKILGLNEYRTQTYESEFTGGNDSQYYGMAQDRIDDLVSAVYDVLATYFRDKHKTDKIEFTENQNGVREYTLTSEVWDKLKLDESERGKRIAGDYLFAAKTFYEELETDYRSALAIDYKEAKIKNIENAEQNFLFGAGLIGRDKDNNAKADDEILARAKSMTREEVINLVFETKMPGFYTSDDTKFSFYEIMNYWVTHETALTEWAAEAKSTALSQAGEVDHIYGITWNGIFNDTEIDSVSGEPVITPACFDRESNSVVIGDNTYELAQYDSEGNLISGFEILNIRINKVDPKAIWSFAVSITPMNHYSNVSQISLWDGRTHFGVEFADVNFYNTNVKTQLVPKGAGAYKASSKSGSVAYKTFFVDNIVHYERNTYFYTIFCDQDGKVGSEDNNAKIKYVRYRVTNPQQLMDALLTKAVDYGDPSATSSNLATVDANKKLLGKADVANLGYGYIGINAGKPGLESIYVRRAIMCAMDTRLVLDYYPNNMAELIYRPMSKASWAYPTSVANPYYQYDGSTSANSAIRTELRNAVESNDDYSITSDGKFNYKNSQLKLTFTIAGQTDDHPAFLTMKNAAELLGECGINVEVKTDPQALKKLATGGLQVWAAAWQAAIDPDMFQVYHKDSTATSTYNWGYREIFRDTSGKYDEEIRIIEELSGYIDEARKVLDEESRKTFYALALDQVMELAVELPTYQRKNLFVYNIKKLDVNTLEKNVTPYQSPLAYLWKVNYKTK